MFTCIFREFGMTLPHRERIIEYGIIPCLKLFVLLSSGKEMSFSRKNFLKKLAALLIHARFDRRATAVTEAIIESMCSSVGLDVAPGHQGLFRCVAERLGDQIRRHLAELVTEICGDFANRSPPDRTWSNLRECKTATGHANVGGMELSVHRLQGQPPNSCAGAGVHESAPIRSEFQSSGPGTLTICLGEVHI
jgi:hypothetical protein